MDNTGYYVQYYGAKLFTEFSDDIINNKITKITPRVNLITKKNCEQFIKLLEKNTSIESIEFEPYVYNTECFRLLSEILKNNDTLKTLYFKSGGLYPEAVRLLMEGLIYNKSVKNIMLSRYTFDSDELDVVTNMLKINDSITYINISLERVILNSNTIINFIDSLTFNKVLTSIYIPLYFGDINVCKQFANMLKVNKTLMEICVFSGAFINPDGMKLILNALKENAHIISVGTHSSNLADHLCLGKIKKYCDRNKHNLRLKAKTLSDITYVRKSSNSNPNSNYNTCCLC
jgi:hypothetical protein